MNRYEFMMKVAFQMHNENAKFLANGIKVTAFPHWRRRVKKPDSSLVS